MTGITCALAGSGGRIAGTSTVTSGYAEGGDFYSYGFGTGGQGSITPALWANTSFPVATLKDVYFEGAMAWIDFSVTGNASNSGWSTMTVNGTSLNRVDASYSYNGTTTSWIFVGAPNLFGILGSVRTVVWA
jgi:hypothetical protein